MDPLCLPPAGASVESVLRGEQAEVSGWGLTEKGQTATVLQKAILPFVSKDICNPIFDNELVPEQVQSTTQIHSPLLPFIISEIQIRECEVVN